MRLLFCLGITAWMALWAHPVVVHGAGPPGSGFSPGSGFYRDGQYFGFVPKHERLLADPHSVSGMPGFPADVWGDQGLVAAPTAAPGWWFKAEYLHWWTERMAVPPLATTSAAGTGQEEAGVLGEEATTILLGDRGLTNSGRSGGQFTLGKWFDPLQTSGWDVTVVVVEPDSNRFAADDATHDILARPFFNTVLDQQDARLIVFPNLVEGALQIAAETEFHTLSVLYRRVALRDSMTQLDWVAGYRFAFLEDSLAVQENTTGLSGPTDDVMIDLAEQFLTRNTFHGGQLGLKLVHQPTPNCALELMANFGLGGTNSRINISGETTTTAANGTSTTAPGGLLAQETNIGQFRSDQFSTFIELGVTLRRQLRWGPTATLGYSFMHWSDVMRAGDQIDRQINTTQIPPGTLNGDPRPIVPFQSSDFWVQGLRTGLEFHF